VLPSPLLSLLRDEPLLAQDASYLAASAKISSLRLRFKHTPATSKLQLKADNKRDKVERLLVP
jgi:hypothetical protein